MQGRATIWQKGQWKLYILLPLVWIISILLVGYFGLNIRIAGSWEILTLAVSALVAGYLVAKNRTTRGRFEGLIMSATGLIFYVLLAFIIQPRLAWFTPPIMCLFGYAIG